MSNTAGTPRTDALRRQIRDEVSSLNLATPPSTSGRWEMCAVDLERENAELRAAAEKALLFIDRLKDDRAHALPGGSDCSIGHYAEFHADNLRAALAKGGA